MKINKKTIDKYKYLNPDDPNIIKAEGLNEPSILHYCPGCNGYLWADDQHKSYRYCVHCGRNLKTKTLPYESI